MINVDLLVRTLTTITRDKTVKVRFRDLVIDIALQTGMPLHDVATVIRALCDVLENARKDKTTVVFVVEEF